MVFLQLLSDGPVAALLKLNGPGDPFYFFVILGVLNGAVRPSSFVECLGCWDGAWRHVTG